MLKRLVAVALCLAVLCGRADANNRTTSYYNAQPSSSQANQAQRYQRLADGALMQTVLGSNASGYSNLTVAPVTGLYVDVAPSVSGTQGALYQVHADDATAWGVGPINPSAALPADATQIPIQATLAAATPSIGPLAVPSTVGYSQITLIECQVVTADANPTATSFLTPLGALSSSTVDINRLDTVTCQAKVGTASASPSVPTVDSGWVAIGYVTVPYGTTTLTSGMVTAEPPISVSLLPSQLAVPTTTAAATFPTPTGSAAGYTLPGVTTLTQPLLPTSGGLGALTGVSSVSGIVVGFGDSLVGNGGNGVTAGYCGTFNTIMTPVSVNGCTLDQLAQHYGVQENNLGIAGSCLGTYSSLAPVATTAVTATGSQTVGVTPADIGLFFVGQVIYYDNGTNQEPIVLTGVNATAFTITAVFAQPHSVGAHIGDFCSGGSAGITRYLSQLVPYCVPGNLVWFEYNFLNEIYHGDLGFAAAGGLAAGVAQLKTMIDACKAGGATIVMQDTTHQAEEQGETYKIPLEGQARAAVQTLAAQEGVLMARAYEALTPCWFDAILAPNLSLCSANDGIHPSNGLTGLTVAITTTGTQAASVFNPTGVLYPPGSTITVDTGTNVEYVTVTGNSPTTISGNFTKTHPQFTPVYSNVALANVGNTMLAQAIENATYTSTLANGAGNTVYAASTIPQQLNQPTFLGCTYVITPGAQPPAGCTSGTGVLLITTSPTTGEIIFGGPSTYGTMQFVGGVPNFAFSNAINVAGTGTFQGLITTNDESINISDTYGLKINDSSGNGAAMNLNETGGTLQNTGLTAGFPSVTLNSVAGNVFALKDYTANQIDLTMNSSGDLSVRGKLVAYNGVYPNSSTGASWQTSNGAPTTGCTTATAGSIDTVYGPTTLSAALYICVNVSGTASWNAVTIP